MGIVTLGGEVLAPSNGGYYIANVVRPLPSVSTKFSSGFNDGEVFENAALRNPIIEFDIWMTAVTSGQRRKQIREISDILSVSTPTSLEFSDDGGMYYQVVRDGDIVPNEYHDSAMVHVKFKSLYPWMFGEAQYFTSGEAFEPQGNFPGAIELASASSLTPDSNSKIEFGGLTFTMPSTSNYTLKEFNTERRRAKFGNDFYAPALSNTWPTVTPGVEKTIDITKGTGTINFKYVPRWI